MYPIENASVWITLAVVAETLSLLLFSRANTLWRSPGMLVYPQRFLVLRSALVLLWVHLGIYFLAPEGLRSAYGSLDVSVLWVVALGLLGGRGFLLYSLSIRTPPAHMVFFGGSLHLVVSVGVGWLLGELISGFRLAVIAVLLVAQAGVIYRDRSQWALQSRRTQLLPFAVGAIWGLYFPLYGLAIRRWGFWPTLTAAEWAVFLLMLGWALVRTKGTWSDRSMWRNMAEQSLLSSAGQALSGAALAWGGVILHSILTNFNVVLNTLAFRIRYRESLGLKYLVYFSVYIALAIVLILGS
ncbi:MAG: hypothetical protein ACO3PE_04315 [Schleiferiaceae bacterium]